MSSNTNKIKRIIRVNESTHVIETDTHKFMRSPNVNFNFNKEDGFMQRWGTSVDDDPDFAPCPEILDIEITSICNGPAQKLCSYCYKANTPKGHNMTFDEFKNIIDKMPFLTQIALGADAHGTTNPDMFKMMEYARSQGIIPNLTIADVSQEIAEKLAKVAGAVAVSVHPHVGLDVAFDSVARLAAAGQKQINIHYVISANSINNAYVVANAQNTDPRLSTLNAIVFLSLKQKRRGKKFEYVNQEQYANLVQHCLDNNVRFGFDSCSAPQFLESVKHHENFSKFKELSEDCESTCFSSYINEHGKFFPCSFTEDWVEGGWSDAEGLDVIACDNFIDDIWNHTKTTQFRNTLIGNKDSNGCRNCPAFTICGRQGYMKVMTEQGYVTASDEVIGDINCIEVK